VHDISPQVIDIEIIENIFEPFTTGNIIVNDGIDALDVFPLIGNEVLELTFNTPSLEDKYAYKRLFAIYNCSDKIYTTGRSAMYKLRIISLEAVLDKTTRVSHTFRGKPHDIANDIIKNYLKTSKNIITKPAINDVVFISNWWHPTKCLDYLSKHAVNSNYCASFIFFEANDGFHFESIEQMFANPVKQDFYVNDYATPPAANENSTSPSNIDADYKTVLQVNYNTGFDFFERLSTGFFGGEIVALDVNTQQYIHTVAGHDFERENHLNAFDPAPVSTGFGKERGYMQYIPFVTQNFTGQNRGVQDTEIPFRMSRHQFFSRLKTTQAAIKVHGRCDYHPGMLVNLFVPKNAPISNSTEIQRDLLTSGNYIVTSIRHIVNGEKHVAYMQLMKESYMFDVSHSALNPSVKTEIAGS
jgi:hypothetical protein